MGQGFTLIYRSKFTWMDEFVPKPREFCGIESFHQPVDHVPHPGDAAAAGMIGKPDVEWPAQLDFERYHFSAKRGGVGGKYADSGTIGDGPIVGAAHIGLHHQQVAWRVTRKQAFESLLGR